MRHPSVKSATHDCEAELSLQGTWYMVHVAGVDRLENRGGKKSKNQLYARPGAL